MKFLFDLFPVLLSSSPSSSSTSTRRRRSAIAATVLQIGWLKWKRRKVDKMMWVTLAIIAVFGGATLALHDETFIKWKPTVLYWLFGAVIAGGAVAVPQERHPRDARRAAAPARRVWTRLNWSWAAFFVFMGGANLYVAFNFPTETWVNFKLFGGMGLMLVFVVLQAVFLARHMEEKQ